MIDPIDLALSSPPVRLRYGPSHAPQGVDLYRLVVPRLWAGSTPGVRHLVTNAWVDTGAQICVFPQHTWVNFEADVQFHPTLGPGDVKAPAHVANKDRRFSTDIGGGTWTYRLGEVDVAVQDQHVHSFVYPSIRVIAKFLDEPVPGQKPPSYKALIGLERSVFAGRRLHCDPVHPAPYRQRWRLYRTYVGT